eukprot:TRINITY_DN1063_c0_g1_i1.p1 TRINITY_DN1063_c0_g1~~TRINITY_DN1063_c0_g1_i1.p1  ORF type:complete len:555 (-),score=122.66 TRINITY_DN1063_c0_g1_i1:308-1972(-)
MFSGEKEGHSAPAPEDSTGILVGSARRSSGKPNKAAKTPRSVQIDPYQEISDQCKVSTSQEEIFDEAIAAANSKRKSPIKDGSQRESPAKRNLGLSVTKRKISGGSTARDPSNTPISFVNTDDEVDDRLGLPKGKILSEMDLGFFKRIKFLISSGKFPDLQSLKDSGVLLERDLDFFKRMKFLISRGQLPDLGFPKPKVDSPAPADDINTSASLGLSQMNPKESGVSKGEILSEWDLRFHDRMKFLISTGAFPDLESLKESGILSERDLLLFQRMKFLISKGELPDLGFLNTNEDSRVGNLHTSKEKSPERIIDKGPETEMDIQKDAGIESPDGESPLEINVRLSKSKGDSSGGFSSKDVEVLQKSIALLVAMMKDANAMNASHDQLDKRGASISKSKSLIEKNSGMRRSGKFSGPAKERLKRPAHEDIGSGEEDVGPRDDFARFRYCQSGKPPNHPRSMTQETDTIRIASTASHTRRIGRKLPPSLQSTSRGWAKSSNAASQNEITKKLLDFAEGVSKVSDRHTGDEDILKVAERAGYIFPRPRWWPPEEHPS